MADVQIQKPLTFTTPADVTTRHTTHLLCQQLPGRYLLSFFEAVPPIIMGQTDAERQQEWSKIPSIQATCVARVLVAEADLASFIQVLQQQQAAAKQAAGGFNAFVR